MASPITDYATLRLNTADYIARDDLDQWFDVWLLNAERRLSSALKVPGMEKVVTAPIDSTTLTADLPTDYIEWMGLTWKGAGANAPSQTVRYVEINSPEWQHRYRPSGNPMYFTVAGQKIRLKPARAGSVEFIYYGNIAALTPGQTNYLITKAPHLYLAAVLAEAYAFQKDLDNAAAWMKVMDDRLTAFINESGSAKIGRRVERAAEDAAEDHAAKAIV